MTFRPTFYFGLTQPCPQPQPGLDKKDRLRPRVRLKAGVQLNLDIHSENITALQFMKAYLGDLSDLVTNR